MSHWRCQEKNCRDPECDFIIAVVHLILLGGGHGRHVRHISNDWVGYIHNLLWTGGVDDESAKGRSKEGWETSDAGENAEGWSEMLQTENINLEQVLVNEIFARLSCSPAERRSRPARLRGRGRTWCRRWSRTRSGSRTSSRQDRSLLNIIIQRFIIIKLHCIYRRKWLRLSEPGHQL